MLIGLTALLIASPTLAASPDEAKLFIQSLDRAISKSNAILEANNVAAYAQNSRTMKALEEEGRKFEAKAFDEPYGYCFAASVAAKNWWQASLNNGKETLPGDVANAAERYQDHKIACLAAADEEDAKK